MMRWWVSVLMAARAVDSCLPPAGPVPMNRPAYLPQRPPDCHSPPVASQKAFHWAGKLPYLVGIPSMKASYVFKISGVMVGMSDFGGACILLRISSERVSLTLSSSCQSLHSEETFPSYPGRRRRG